MGREEQRARAKRRKQINRENRLIEGKPVERQRALTRALSNGPHGKSEAKGRSLSYLATQTGVCGHCLEEIKVGQRVHDSRYGTVHDRHSTKPEPVDDICPTCHLARPCEC